MSTLPAREAAMEIAPEAVSGQYLEHHLEANVRRIGIKFLHGQAYHLLYYVFGLQDHAQAFYLCLRAPLEQEKD